MGQPQPRLVRVLVVEDDVVSHRIIASSLQRRGFEVVHAKGTAEAISMLEKNSDIAVVLSHGGMLGEIEGSILHDWLLTNRPGLPVIRIGERDESKGQLP